MPGKILAKKRKPSLDFELASLVIVGREDPPKAFHVKVAVTERQRERGLQFVHDLAKNEGMIFLCPEPQRAALWMKNTFISLDILFVRPDRTIGRIVAEASPHDLTPIHSRGQVIAVIEIKGGEAKRRGIVRGCQVVSPLLPPPMPQ